MNMLDVLCIGNAKIDVFVMLTNLNNFSYDKFANQISFPLGAKIPFGDHPLTLGGNACNVSVGLSKLGVNAGLAAVIGNDDFSKKISLDLKTANVNLDNLTTTTDTNPSFNIALSFNGERTILEEENSIKQKLKILSSNPKLIYLTSVGGDWKSIFTEAIENNPNAELVMNPGSKMLEENLDEVINFFPKLKFLFINLQEAQRIVNDDNPDIKIIIKKLKTWGIKNAIITDGINGSYSIDEADQIYQISTATPEIPFEKTGAGDSYAAGFMYAILKGYNVSEAMKYGAINADSVISKIGAQTGLLNSEQIEQKAKELLNLNAIKI